jgi:hypothetical protein
VAVLGVELGQRFERCELLVLRLADPTRIPLVNGIFSSPAASIVASALAGCLVRGARVDGVHQALGDRLEHQTLRGRDLAQATQIVMA